MTSSTAAALVALIASAGIVLDAMEILRARHILDHLFDWKTFQRHRRWPTLGLGPIGKAIRDPSFKILVAAHAFVAVASGVALAYELDYVVLATAFVVGVRCLIEYRFPCSNTAADQMQLLIWIALSIFAAAGEGTGEALALSFIGMHGLLAYFTAGVSKLRKRSWRTGTAVEQVIKSDVFGMPTLAAIVPLGLLSPLASWSTLALEIGGPTLIAFGPEAALVFCTLAALFHVGIAFTMGLTPFIFAFGATYPAIYWLALFLETSL